MPTVTKCFAPVLGKRLRVTRLDSCGNVPASGTADSVVVTNGFVSVSLSAQIESGAEILVKDAMGAIRVNERVADSFKRFTVNIVFCNVDPGLLSVLTQGEIYQDYNSDISGLVIPEGQIAKRAGLEVWTGLSGQACEPGVEEASGYMTLPFVNGGSLGDLEVSGENAVSFSMQNGYTVGGNNWGAGPYGVVADASGNPAVLPTPLDPLDHLLLLMTGIAPPPAACGLQPFIPIAA